MKAAFLIIIVAVSYLSFKLYIPPIPLLFFYGFLIVLPVIFILVKKNMVNALMVWFFFLMFSNGLWGYGTGKISLLMLPDIFIERIIWVALFSLFFVNVASRQSKLEVRVTSTEVAMFILCIYIIFSMMFADTLYMEGQGLALNTWLQGYAIPFSMFFLAKHLVNDERKVRKVFVFLTLIGFYLGVTAIFEHYKVDFMVFPEYITKLRYGIHFGRARGPFLNASINGTVIGIITISTIFLALQENRRWVRNFYVFSIVIMLVGILFTLTRAVWLGFILSSFLLPIFMPRIRKVFFASLMALIIVAGLSFSAEQFKVRYRQNISQKDKLSEQVTGRAMEISPIYGRVNLYAIVWDMFLDNPFFGVGFNTFREKNSAYMRRVEGIPYEINHSINIHDTWSGILAELGLLGLGLFLFIIFSILWATIKSFRIQLLNENARNIIIILWCASIIYLVNFQFVETRYFMFANSLFYLIAGMSVGMSMRSKDKLSALHEQSPEPAWRQEVNAGA